MAEYSERTAKELHTAFTRRFAVLWRDVLYPQMQRATPVRSGQLKRAMKIGYADGKFVLYFDKAGFYWRFQRGLPEKYQQIYDGLIQGMVDTAFEQAKADVGLE